MTPEKWWVDDGKPCAAAEIPDFDGIERRLDDSGQWEPPAVRVGSPEREW